MGGDEPKQFLELGGVPLLLRSIRPFASHPAVRQIVVALPAERAESPPAWLAELVGDRVRVVPGGAARYAIAGTIGCFSVLMGLGGGTLGVPTLTLLDQPIHRAVGTAAGVGLLIAVPGALAFAWLGLGIPGRPPTSLGSRWGTA